MVQNVSVAFGKVLRDLRTARRLTQEELGFRAGIQRKHVSALELGNKHPSVATLFALANALQVEPCDFVKFMQQQLSGNWHTTTDAPFVG